MADEPMAADEALTRPIGWWLKQADARLDAAFDRAVADLGGDRRGWQVLSVVAVRPTPRTTIVAALTAFDSPEAVAGAVQALVSDALLEQDGGVLRLTLEGARRHAALSPLVEQVRQTVRDALPEEDYVALIGLLARLVAALDPVAPA